ncbi:hypothetical protein QOT17_008531 [Balamuthia mandrillaris]
MFGLGGTACPFPECFYCVQNDPAKLKKYFRKLPKSEAEDLEGVVMPISSVWQSLKQGLGGGPGFTVRLVECGFIECLVRLLVRGREKEWFAYDQNVYVPFYSLEILYLLFDTNSEWRQRAIQAGLVQATIPYFMGEKTWAEQRVAIKVFLRLLQGKAHTLSNLCPQEAPSLVEKACDVVQNSLDKVYCNFIRFEGARTPHICDLLTRGQGSGTEEATSAMVWVGDMQGDALHFLGEALQSKDCLTASSEAAIRGLFKALPSLSDVVVLSLPFPLFTETQYLTYHASHFASLRRAMAAEPALMELLARTLCTKFVTKEGIAAAINLLKFNVDAVGDILGPALAANVELKLDGHDFGADIISAAQTLPQPLCSTEMAYLHDILAFEKYLAAQRKLSQQELLADQHKAQELKTQGNAAFSQQHFPEAIHHYREALDVVPLKARQDRIAIYGNMAECYRRQEEFTSALLATTRALCLAQKGEALHEKNALRRMNAFMGLGCAGLAYLELANLEDQQPSSSSSGVTEGLIAKVTERCSCLSWLERKHGRMVYEDEEPVGKDKKTFEAVRKANYALFE